MIKNLKDDDSDTGLAGIERKIMIGELSNDKETIKEFLKNIDLKDILKETDYE